MQFSKYVSQQSRLYNIDPKDVLFALLASTDASTAESFAVIYRPAVSTTAGLNSKASNYIGQKPGLKKFIKHLDDQKAAARKDSDEAPAKKRGRPRKVSNETITSVAEIDYTNKDEMLKEAWEQYQGATTEAVKTKWYSIIVDLQKMKQEQTTAEEKRVHFHLPLSVDRSLGYIVRRLKERFQMPDEWEIEALQAVKDSFSSCLL